jgi:ApaG protein
MVKRSHICVTGRAPAGGRLRRFTFERLVSWDQAGTEESMPEFKDETPQPPSSYSEAVTNNVRVEVESEHVPQRVTANALALNGQWLFHYTVRITNEGDETVQLLSRHWIITHGNGRTEEVKGPGVVGEQPVLGPGESFQYTSGCQLSTPKGSMHGTYQMVSEDGTYFDVEIAPFTLHEVYTVH